MEEPTSAATGADTLTGILKEAAAQGYQSQLIGRANGEIECGSCGENSPVSTVGVDHVRRLEGASDAADMMLMLWCPCPSCGHKGVLTVGYGPNASSDDTEIVQHLDLTDADPSPGTEGPL